MLNYELDLQNTMLVKKIIKYEKKSSILIVNSSDVEFHAFETCLVNSH